MGRLPALLLVCACVKSAPRPVPMPQGTPLELQLQGTAKVLCSAVFVSQRSPLEAWENSARGSWLEPDAGATWAVDVPGQRVRVSAGGVTRSAGLHPDQGCIVGEALHFTPQRVPKRLPDAETTPWPMGDLVPDAGGGPDLHAALDAAFADPEAYTAAFIVVHRGRIVAERYGQGATRETPLESWSMGKSLTATLLGLLVKDGVYDVNAPAPVERWANDGRRAIRIIDLLHMSSGLEFRSSHDPDWKPEYGVADHSYIYTGGVDVFEYALDKPPQFPPDTEGRYRNSDPLIIGWLVKRAAGEQYLQWPQRRLFDRLGMRNMVLETDPYGNFLLTGHDYGSARDWARLGLLYQQDGVWEGERLLPEGWTRLVSTPAPAWRKPEYGGLFWLNRTRELDLPESAYSMVGAGGQRVIIVPEHELVIVRMGHSRGWPKGKQSLNAALREVMRALAPAR